MHNFTNLRQFGAFEKVTSFLAFVSRGLISKRENNAIEAGRSLERNGVEKGDERRGGAGRRKKKKEKVRYLAAAGRVAKTRT